MKALPNRTPARFTFPVAHQPSSSQVTSKSTPSDSPRVLAGTGSSFPTNLVTPRDASPATLQRGPTQAQGPAREGISASISCLLQSIKNDEPAPPAPFPTPEQFRARVAHLNVDTKIDTKIDTIFVLPTPTPATPIASVPLDALPPDFFNEPTPE
ncbi:MAG: hypothetical protein K0Q43_586 [Ramlibacter sp.]|jgi:hypothetical protein|nr:hypothetical protein [Ramlibacter sp.]